MGAYLLQNAGGDIEDCKQKNESADRQYCQAGQGTAVQYVGQNFSGMVYRKGLGVYTKQHTQAECEMQALNQIARNGIFIGHFAEQITRRNQRDTQQDGIFPSAAGVQLVELDTGVGIAHQTQQKKQNFFHGFPPQYVRYMCWFYDSGF